MIHHSTADARFPNRDDKQLSFDTYSRLVELARRGVPVFNPHDFEVQDDGMSNPMVSIRQGSSGTDNTAFRWAAIADGKARVYRGYVMQPDPANQRTIWYRIPYDDTVEYVDVTLTDEKYNAVYVDYVIHENIVSDVHASTIAAVSGDDELEALNACDWTRTNAKIPIWVIERDGDTLTEHLDCRHNVNVIPISGADNVSVT